jgi:alkanesulfonate monooxygenase SsuD/methylene tetrahydromethanopterin reductase-like flavin-dependent oxidoreductase (luciferase family)
VAAGVTHRARLGTSTLNALWQPPILLARTLATIDQVSAGRLDVGLGLGWSRDEYQAVGTPWQGQGARLEETLDLFDRIWAEDEVVRHDGALWTVPSAYIRLKPRQRPRPPVLLGGYSPASLARVGRRADGWLGVGLPLPVLTQAWETVAEHAAKAGREPEALRLVLRVNPVFSADPVPDEQVPTRGTVRQLADYLSAAVESLGAEPLIDLHYAAGDPEEYLDLARELHDLVRSRTS